MRLALACGLVLWAGATLLLAELRWFRRRPLVDRLRLHIAGATATAAGGGVLSMSSFRGVIGPLAAAVGARLARVVGVE